MCRHRGNRVYVALIRATPKDFMCSYHGWIFNTEGRLIGVRYPQNIQAHLGHEDKIGPIDQAVLSAANLSGFF